MKGLPQPICAATPTQGLEKVGGVDICYFWVSCHNFSFISEQSQCFLGFNHNYGVNMDTAWCQFGIKPSIYVKFDALNTGLTCSQSCIAVSLLTCENEVSGFYGNILINGKFCDNFPFLIRVGFIKVFLCSKRSW